MSLRRPSLDQILEVHIQALAVTLRPASVRQYRSAARRFLRYLHAAFPYLHRPAQLHRDPHLLGWFRCLCQEDPPLCNKTRICYLLNLRHLFQGLAVSGHSIQPDLIRMDDLPARPRTLPRPLSPSDDQLLQQELRRTDDMFANAMLLTRATGIRVGECADLTVDCLRQLAPDQWALYVPVGKLHTDRMVPVDEDVRRIVSRLTSLRSLAPTSHLANSDGFLLPRGGSHNGFCGTLRDMLTAAAQRAGCSSHVTPHRMRHSFATEMVRLGVSLPALMQLLGHKDISMTLRYVQVTQQDLQREFHTARHNAAQPHTIPALSMPSSTPSADLPGIRQMLATTHHLLEIYRRQLADEQASRKLRRLDRRILAVASELDRFAKPEK
jgi:site-specific recombinase XerD